MSSRSSFSRVIIGVACASGFMIPMYGANALAQSLLASNTGTVVPSGEASQQKQAPKRVTLSLKNVSLIQAIDAIASASGVDVAYSKAVLSKHDKSITIVVADVTVQQALAQTLQGTGFSVASYGGQLAIVESSGGGQIKDNGVIVGRVLHARTKQPMSGVTVLLGDATTGVITGSDGAFRIPAPAGDQRITIRAIGFGRVVRTVKVQSGETINTEVVLEPGTSVLSEVIVTGTVVATERKAIANPITVITAEDIEQRGITRLEQFFRGEVPGVTVLEQGAAVYQDAINSVADNLGGAVASTVYSRGSSGLSSTGAFSGTTTPLKTFVDGVELLDPSYLGSIDPRSVERIEIITGPQAATLYGSGAIGGVMQIFTKKGIGRPAEMTFSARYGVLQSNVSDGKTPTHNYIASVTGSNGPGFSYSGNVSYDYSGQWQPNLFSRRFGGSIGVTYVAGKLTSTGSISTTNTLNGTRAFESGAVLSPMGQYLQSIGEWYPVNVAPALSQRRSRSVNQTVSLSATYQVSPEWQHSMTMGRSQNSFSITPEAPNLSTTTDTLFRSSSASGMRTSWNYNTSYIARSLGWFVPTLTLGANGSSGEMLRAQGCLAATTATSWIGCTSTAAVAVSNALSDRSWGGFGSLRFGVFDQLFLTLGLRAEKNPNYGRDRPIDWTPTNGITYTNSIGDLTFKLLGSYGLATRPPAADRRLEVISVTITHDPASYVSRFANPELRPEYARGPQGGIELYYGNLGSITVNHYQQTVTDLIQTIVVDSVQRLHIASGEMRWTGQSMYLNAATVRQHGWEGTGAVNAGPLSFKGTYSWTDSRIRSVHPRAAQSVVGRSFNNVLTHVGNVRVSYSLGGTSIMTSTSIIGSTLVGALDASGDPFGYYDRQYTRHKMYMNMSPMFVCNCVTVKPGYSKTDVAFSHRVKENVTATLNMFNIGNNYSSDVQFSNAWPSLGRQTTLGISLRYR